MRRGPVRSAHFVHFSDSEIPCFLSDHNLLQALILHRFRLAVRDGLRFELYLRTSRDKFFFDLRALGNEMKREYTLVENTRSDLVSSGSGKEFIIEIVDTHPMSSETVEAYWRSGYPVLQLDVVDYEDFLAGRLLPKRLEVSHFLNLVPHDCLCVRCSAPYSLFGPL